MRLEIDHPFRSRRFRPFVLSILSQYDTRKMGRVRIYLTSQKYWYGRCGQNVLGTYTLSVGVPECWQFPKTFIGEEFALQGTLDVECRTRDEAAVYLLAHELFHFLRFTRQLSVAKFGRNDEANANRYAYFALVTYRTWKPSKNMK